MKQKCVNRLCAGLKVTTILGILILCFYGGHAQTLAPVPDKKPIPQPHDLKVLDEHVDDRGYTVRTVEYIQGGVRITETTMTPPKPSYKHVAVNPDRLDKDSLVIVVDKSQYLLSLFYKRKLIRVYRAVFGPHPLLDKCIEGDRCTPEGWFQIVRKNPASRYDKFMMLSYPDNAAVARFNKLKEDGRIPRNARIGGDVGIHGIWPGGDDMIEMGVGWTDGCIALKNSDIEELYSLVGVGTRVFIRK